MKGKYIIAIFVGLLLAVAPAWADDSWETWAAGKKVGNLEYNAEGTVTITLKGDVYLSGTITVNGNGTTVRFLNTSGKEVTIYNDGDAIRTAPMFKVINGSKLAFNYKDYPVNDADNLDGSNSRYKRIIIDGGAGFSDMDSSSPDGEWTLTPAANGKMFRVSMFQSIGALEFYHVLIRNYHGENSTAADGVGVIGLAPPGLFAEGSNLNYRYTRVVCSAIEKCKARSGTALSVGNNNYLNKSQDPNHADRLITFLNDTIRNCVQYCDNSLWGGVFRFRGGSHHSLTLKNTIFHGNFSQGDGAGLWWNAAGHKDTKCIIDGCTFTRNRAMRESGGLRLETTFEFSGEATTTVSGNQCLGKTKVVSGNTCTYEEDEYYRGNGAGIHIFGYAGSKGTVGGTFTYDLPSTLHVYKNVAAGYGGGIAFDFKSNNLKKGTRIESVFNGVRVYDNEAGIGGGGIYFSNTTKSDSLYVFDVCLNSGVICLNEAPSGGGIYVNKININSEATGSDVSIHNNKATRGNGGGIYLMNGNITLNSVRIYENSANNDANSYGGGGLYVNGGSFTINTGSITRNTTNQDGGGVCIYNNLSNTKPSLTLSGGVISENVARNGGGIAACGATILSIKGVKVEKNRAKIGGGVYAIGIGVGKGTEVYYYSGVVRNNIAEKDAQIETAYNELSDDITGVGGGIYMGHYTHLEFPEMTHFGIYGNVAENGADDIFGYNRNVYIVLPNVENLDLSDYQEAHVHKLFWGEDYITNDPNYDKGTKLKGAAWDADKTNQRYRDVLNKKVEGKYYIIDFNGAANKHFEIVNNVSTYLCLTLGWSVNTIKLIKKGMKDGENAIFKILKKEDNNAYSEYMTVVLTDQDKQADGTRCKEIALISDGTWRVEELNWSWAYTPTVNYIEKPLDAANTNAEFYFENTIKEDIPIHHESIIVNKMKNGGGK